MKSLKTTLEVLSPAELDLIHEKTAAILEHTGLRVPHAKALRLAEELGARVDRQKQVMYIPRKALETLVAETRANGGMQEDGFHTGHKLTGYVSTMVRELNRIYAAAEAELA